MKRLPPYGKQLLKRMRDGEPFTRGINIYTSWNMGRIFPHGITFPPEANPNEFNWIFLAGKEISLINIEGYAEYETLKELAVLLVKSGVKNVGLVDPEHDLQWFIPELKEDAA